MVIRKLDLHRKLFILQTKVLRSQVLIFGTFVTGLVVAAETLGLLQASELRAFDFMGRVMGAPEADPRLLVVAVTEADIKALGTWPMADATLARVLGTLQSQEPAAIGLDLYRDIAYPPGQAALRSQLQAENLIAIAKLPGGGDIGVEAPAGVPADRIGFNDVILDPDGAVRRHLVLGNFEGEVLQSFALRLALEYLETTRPEIAASGVSPHSLRARKPVEIGTGVLIPLTAGSGGYANIDSTGFQVIPNPRFDQLVPEITIGDVLAGRVDPELVRGKIVLVGATAPSLNDYFLASSATQSQNPLISGVQLQAQYVSYLLDTAIGIGSPIGCWPRWMEILWIWLWAGIGGAIAWRIQKPLLAAIVGGCVMAGLVCVSLALLAGAVWVPAVAPLVALALAFVTVLASYRWEEQFLDKVTQLPKRKFLLARLETCLQETAKAPERPLALVLFSFERLADIRHGLGDWLADRALAAVARDIDRALADRGMVARVGDSELAAVAIVRGDRREEFARRIEQLREQLSQPRTVDELAAILKPEIATIWKSQYSSLPLPATMLEDAYGAIEQLPDEREVASPLSVKSLRQSVLEDIRGEVLIQEALDRQYFELYYQPVIDLPTQKILGFEALVRLQSPQHGTIAPVKFIPLAERTGQIVPLGRWILQAACQQCRRWQERFPQLDNLTVNVNISAPQFEEADLANFIAATLEEAGLAGSALTLEITEGIVMKNIDRTLETIARLKTLDIEIAIDDFGTGFSSLSYLRDFNVDVLKIDRSFVSRMGSSQKDLAIVKTILALCKLLDLRALAEGIETPEECQVLLASECQMGQGYFFAKPMDAIAATQYLTRFAKP